MTKQKALFYLPKTKTYKYFDVDIRNSTIKGAGKGVFALNQIPRGARGMYKGIPKSEDDANMSYSWEVYPWDEETGEVDDEDEDSEPIYYIDSFELEWANWARYVNCGVTSKHNNLSVEQIYGNFYYITMRNISPGEELFVDYGLEYRKENLGLTEPY